MKCFRGVLVATAAFSMIIGGASAAHAETPTDEVNYESVSHVQIEAEFRFAEGDKLTGARHQADGTDIGPSPGYRLDPSILPGKGEVVIVHYTNAVETLYAPTAACTQSATASTPWKSAGRARGKVALSRSSGCSGTWQGNGEMKFRNIIGLWQSSGATSTTSLSPGESVTKWWSSACTGTRRG